MLYNIVKKNLTDYFSFVRNYKMFIWICIFLSKTFLKFDFFVRHLLLFFDILNESLFNATTTNERPYLVKYLTYDCKRFLHFEW